MGYQKIALSAGYNLVGIQFSQIGGDSLNLSTAVLLDSGYAGYDDDYNFSTTLRVWNGSEYVTYGWAGTSGTDVDNDPTLDNTWTDLEAYEVEGETLDTAQGIWIRAAKAGTALVAGEVTTTSVTLNLIAGPNLIASPYPTTVKVTDFGILDSSFSGYDADYNFKTRLRKWNGTEYIAFGWAGTSGTVIDEDPSLDNTWTDLEAYETAETIAPGEGVWILSEKAGTITFTFPQGN